jgi:hypothetical protein
VKGFKRFKPRRELDAEYRKWIITLPCLVTGDDYGVIGHHVRDSRFERGGASGKKSSDYWMVPLRHDYHTDTKYAVHQIGERKFWADHGIDIQAEIGKLNGEYGKTPDPDAAPSVSRV